MDMTSLIQQIEQDVVGIFVAIKNGVTVEVSDAYYVLQWLASHAPQISIDLQTAINLVSGLGLTADPKIAAAVAAAKVANAAFSAFAASVPSGQPTADAVIAGYQAFTAVQQAIASTKAAATATSPVTPPAISAVAAVPAVQTQAAA